MRWMESECTSRGREHKERGSVQFERNSEGLIVIHAKSFMHIKSQHAESLFALFSVQMQSTEH